MNALASKRVVKREVVSLGEEECRPLPVRPSKAAGVSDASLSPEKRRTTKRAATARPPYDNSPTLTEFVLREAAPAVAAYNNRPDIAEKVALREAAKAAKKETKTWDTSIEHDLLAKTVEMDAQAAKKLKPLTLGEEHGLSIPGEPTAFPDRPEVIGVSMGTQTSPRLMPSPCDGLSVVLSVHTRETP